MILRREAWTAYKDGHMLLVSFSVGGVFGAAAERPFLPHSGGFSGSAWQRVAVLRPQVQPAEQPESQQPGQWLYTHLPAVPGLRAPGELHPHHTSSEHSSLPLLRDSAPIRWLNVIHKYLMRSSHSSKLKRQVSEKGKNFICHYKRDELSLLSAGHVITYSTREWAERLLPRCSMNPVLRPELSALACFSIPSHFGACLERHVENSSLGIESL